MMKSRRDTSLLKMFDDPNVEEVRLEKHVRRLSNRKGRAELVLAGALARLARDQRQGFDAEKLGVKYRRAMYLIAIYDHFQPLDIDEGRLATMGWSKAKELVGIATRDNFNELADFAESHKRTTLIAHLNEHYGRLSSFNKSAARTGAQRGGLSLQLNRNLAVKVRAALDLARGKYGFNDESEALERICAEWAER